MDTFPTLFSDRLILRKIDADDLPNLIKYANNKNISDQIVNMPYPYREPDAVFRISRVVQGFKNKNRFVFSIILKEANSFIGEVVLHLEEPGIGQLGYWLGEPYWGQGLMTEAVGAVLNFGFEELKLKSIYASTKVDNTGSNSVLIKHKMKRISRTGEMLHYKLDPQNFNRDKQ